MTLEALAVAHTERRRSVIERVLRAMLGLWDWRGTRHNPTFAAGAVAQSVVLMDSALASMREMENAWVAAYAEDMGVPYSPEELTTDPLYVRDADIHEVYERVMDDYRYNRYGGGRSGVPEGASRDDLSESGDLARIEADLYDALVKEFDPPPDTASDPEYWERLERLEAEAADAEVLADEEAFQKALRGLETRVSDDLVRAGSDEQRQLLSKKRIWIGYRRVIHPELSETGVCGLCVAASTRIYQTKVLMPIHGLCKCTQIGVSEDRDPGEELNTPDIDGLFVGGSSGDDGKAVKVDFSREQLDQLYADAGGSTFADALKNVRYTEWDNENGPTLGWSGKSKGSFSEPSMEATRAKWERTLSWAKNKRYQAVTAKQNNRDTLWNDAYDANISNFDDLITLMESKLGAAKR